MTKKQFLDLKSKILNNVIYKDKDEKSSFFISILDKNVFSLHVKGSEFIITSNDNKFVTRQKSNIVATYKQKEIYNRKVWERVC